MHYQCGQTAAKKGIWPLSTAHIRQKSRVTLTVVVFNDSSAIYIASSESSEPKRFDVGTNLKNNLLRTTNKSVP